MMYKRFCNWALPYMEQKKLGIGLREKVVEGSS